MPKFIRTSLQVKLILLFVLSLLTPLAIITIYSVNSSTAAIVAATTEHELNTALRSEDAVRSFLSQMKGDLIFLHRDPGAKDYAGVLAGEDDPAALPDIEDLFTNFMTNSSINYQDIRILDANRQEVVRVNSQNRNPVMLPAAELVNDANSAYFQEAMKLPRGQVYFSGLDLNRTNGVVDTPPLPVLRYSIPLYTEEDQLVGVIVIKALANPILSTLVPDEENEQTYLIDEQGNYWLNPDTSKLYGSIVGTGANFTKDQPNDAAYMRENTEGLLQASADRPNDFQAFIQIPLEDKPGDFWTLINVRPEAGILGQITEARTTILAIAAVAFLLAAITAIILARGIVNPLTRLTRATAEIAQNRWNIEVPTVDREDEIATLTDSFRSMTQAVRSRNDELSHLNEALIGQTKDLTKANAIARESVRLKSEFMSTMSHELRTPLNAILGFSGIMLGGMGGEMDEEARHMTERVEANSQRLLHLINDVLDLAKIEAGRMELVEQPFSPRALAERWVSDTSVLAQKKALQLKIDIDPTLPDVMTGNSERISQIAINLLSNAFKFTQQGAVTLSLDKQDTTWSIKVSDTGIGIPPHALSYIFDEFRQVDGTSTRAFGGTGLGLSICRNLCRMMDGTIQVTSELGKGSVFTATLPLTTEHSGNGVTLPLVQTN